jgi:hypothetical protein
VLSLIPELTLKLQLNKQIWLVSITPSWLWISRHCLECGFNQSAFRIRPTHFIMCYRYMNNHRFVGVEIRFCQWAYITPVYGYHASSSGWQVHCISSSIREVKLIKFSLPPETKHHPDLITFTFKSFSRRSYPERLTNWCIHLMTSSGTVT